MAEIIKDKNFHVIATGVKPDAKKRVMLSKVPISEDVTYYVYCNDIGQIVLDPHVSIPASEAWLFKNPEALETVKAGLKEAAEKKVSKVNFDEL
jgi:hypothetical protein